MDLSDNNELILYRERPKDFFKKLYNLYLHKKDSNDIYIQNIVIDLNKIHKIDICQISVDAINEGVLVFNVYNCIKNGFPLLNHDLKSLMIFIKTIYYAMEKDGFSYKQYDLIIELAKNDPKLIKDLLNELMKLDDRFIINYIATINEFFSETEFEIIHPYLIEKTESENEIIIQAAISSLSRLKYNENDSFIEKTLNIYEKLLLKKSVQINNSIVFGLKSFITKSERAESILKELSLIKDSNISYYISQLLFSDFKELSHRLWFIEVLTTLNDTKCEMRGTIRYLDLILSDLIKDDSKIHIAENFFKEWIIKSDYINQHIKIEELWYSTLNAFRDKEDSISKLITNLFNSDEFQCHIVVNDIIGYFKQEINHKVLLNSKLLKGYNIIDIIFICKKILGYINSPEISYNLLNSIALSYKDNEKVVKIICDIYINQLSKDFMGTTLKLIEASIIELEQNYLKTELENVYLEIKQRIETLNSLPRLKELEVSKKMSYQIMIEESKKMQKSMKKTEERSPLLNLFTNIPVKYGSGWFNYQDNDYSEIHRMSSFSNSIELPRTELTQPVKAAYKRIKYQLAKRGNI